MSTEDIIPEHPCRNLAGVRCRCDPGDCERVDYQPSRVHRQMADLRASVQEYRGWLVITGHDGEADPNWTPRDETKIGCLVHDTDQRLGISPEALELLKTVEVSADAIGDVTWWASSGISHFGWVGDRYRIADPDSITANREFQIRGHQRWHNEVPEAAKLAIDEKLDMEPRT